MDYSNAIGIDDRLYKDAEYQGQQVRVVHGSRIYETAIDELWDAVTNPDRLPLWFAAITGELTLGGRYQLKGDAGGEITRCDSPTAFDITWEFGGNVSLVTVRLEPAGDGTRMTLEHRIGKDKSSEEHWKKYGPGATGVGWDFGFLGLGLYLNSGEPVVESETNSWAVSAAGKSFIKDCATAWGEAHIQAGEDRAIAQIMAAETSAFYCGE